MIIESIHIAAFGGIRNRSWELADGVNVFAGDNESGKSSAAMFLKFIFYGLSGRVSKSLGVSERQRWVNRETGQAGGYLIVRTGDGKRFRLERVLLTSDDAPPRERIRIIEQDTGSTVTGQNPGEFFFGMPEDVFTDTCFVSQYMPVKPDILGGASRGAVENLLTSADENIDVRRALKKLESGRKELLTRSGGGEITELRERRGALLAERDSVSRQAAEILSVSASLDEIRRRISELEEDKAHCEAVFRALDVLNVKRQIDAAKEARIRMQDLSLAVEALDSEDSEEAVCEAERDIRAYDEQKTAFEEQFADLPAAEGELGRDELPDPADAVDEVERLDSAARRQLIAGVLALVFGLGCAALTVLLYNFRLDYYFLPLIAALLLVSLGAAFSVLHIRTTEHLKRMLNEWNAESADEIAVAVQERLNVLERQRMTALERNHMETALTAAKARYDAAEEKLRAMAETAGIGEEDGIAGIIAALHREAERRKEERQTMAANIGNLEGRLAVLNEQLSGVDERQASADAMNVTATEAGRTAGSLSGDGVKQLTKKREFTESALKSAQARRTALAEKLAGLGRLNRTPEELTTEIASLDERIEELTLRHEAYELAKDTLAAAGESMRSGVLPRLADHAAAMVQGATGIYDGVALDGSFACSLRAGDGLTSQEILSRGTADLSYLALRIALTGELFREEQPPMILDETFAHVDRKRTEGFMKQLAGRQFLIFTCREEEIAAAEASGGNVLRVG